MMISPPLDDILVMLAAKKHRRIKGMIYRSCTIISGIAGQPKEQANGEDNGISLINKSGLCRWLIIGRLHPVGGCATLLTRLAANHFSLKEIEVLCWRPARSGKRRGVSIVWKLAASNPAEILKDKIKGHSLPIARARTCWCFRASRW